MKAVETLTARVLTLAAMQPERPALSTDGAQPRSYGWLANEVRGAAAALRASGVEPGTRALMDATRDERYVITLLAGWHVGASLVPLSCDLTAGTEAALLAQMGRFTDARSLAWHGQEQVEPAAAPLASDEAYVIFTSGSTGLPKGVRIGHGGLPRLFEEQASLFETTPNTRASWMLAGHFDASISDIGVALWSGATLVIWSGGERGPSMLDFIESAALTQVDLPPSQLPALVARGLPPGLRTLVVGGEPAAPHALRAAARHARVVNVYGPTETTVCASAQVIDPERHADAASLGWPLPGVQFHVQGSELYISGHGVGLGYLDGERNAFVELPGRGPRAYRTGDLVEPQPDGSYRFLGRCDRQVQLRGQRLELAEVESTLLASSDVRAAAVLYLETPAPRVVAFIEGDAAAAEDAAASLQEWKRPSKIQALEKLPRLGNGKVDLAALTTIATEGLPAEDATARGFDPLGRAWCRVLGVAGACEDDDFFTLGGDSVTALELSVEAARAGLAVEPEAIFRSPRLADLRRTITAGRPVGELRAVAELEFQELRLEGGSPPPRGPGVLLTGATGMLGLQILRSGYLGARPVFALVRGRDEAHATERLARLLGGTIPSSVRVLRGDLGLELLGLSAQQHGELRGSVGEIIHSAGAVDLVRSCASLHPVHVTGTARVMELAASLGARLHHVSTLSIFVESDLEPGTIDEALELSDEHRLFGGYAQSKFIGDELARRYPFGGSLLRPGLLSTNIDSSDDSLPMDQLSRVIRGVAALGTRPASADERAFDVTPVDGAARLIAQLVESTAESPGRPVHLAAPSPATGAQLFEAMAAEGIEIQRVLAWPPIDQPNPVAPGEGADRAVALAALTARAHGNTVEAGPRSGDLFLASDHRFHCAYVASRFPGVLPSPPTVKALRALVRTALGRSADLEVAP